MTPALEGKCNSNCQLLAVFLPAFALVILTTFSTSMPALSATMRCVPERQRSFALGIQWILVRCLGKLHVCTARIFTIPLPAVQFILTLVYWDTSKFIWDQDIAGYLERWIFFVKLTRLALFKKIRSQQHCRVCDTEMIFSNVFESYRMGHHS